MAPSAAAATASRPSSAPVGTMIWPPWSRARSIRCGRGSSAPALSTMTRLPARSIGTQMSSSNPAGAHSTASSAKRGNSSNPTNGQAMPHPFSHAFALAWSRAAAHASTTPGSPAARRFATARPIAPRPAMATLVSASMLRVPSAHGLLPAQVPARSRRLSALTACRAGRRGACNRAHNAWHAVRQAAGPRSTPASFSSSRAKREMGGADQGRRRDRGRAGDDRI